MVGHRDLPHVVVAGGELAGHVVEEAQRAGVLVIDSEEVAVHGVARAAAVEHPLPSVLGRDVVAEAFGQVGHHVAIVPGHVHQRVARAALGVGRVLARAVVDVDGLLLAPGGGGEVLVIDVVVVGRGSAVHHLIPLFDEGSHLLVGQFKLGGEARRGEADVAVLIAQGHALEVVHVGLVALLEVQGDGAVLAGGVGEGCEALAAPHLDGVALVVVEVEGGTVARAVLQQLEARAHAGKGLSGGGRALLVEERPPDAFHLVGQRVRVNGVVVLGARGDAQGQQHRHGGEHHESENVFSHCRKYVSE